MEQVPSNESKWYRNPVVWILVAAFGIPLMCLLCCAVAGLIGYFSYGTPGTSSVEVPAPAEPPAVSLTATPNPDASAPLGGGGRIAYTAGLNDGAWFQVRIYDVTTGTDTVLYEDAPYKYAYSWSMDGELLLFQSDFHPPNSRILAVDVAGGEPRVVVGDKKSRSWMPSLSPDGEKIAFCSDRDGDVFNIYVVNLDGTGLTRLTDFDSSSPQWSPDGKKIVFQANIGDNFEIFVMDADGANPVNLTNHPASDMGPSWSPDGKSISFVSNRDSSEEKHDLFLMKSDGTGLLNLTNTPGAWESGTSFSPDGKYIVFEVSEDGIPHLYFLELASLEITPVPVEADNASSAVWWSGQQP